MARDVVCDNDAPSYYTKLFLHAPLISGKCPLILDIETACDDLEVRLWVGEQTNLSVQGIELEAFILEDDTRLEEVRAPLRDFSGKEGVSLSR